MNEVKYEEISFLSADQKTTVRGYFWSPATPPKAIIQLSHGMCEYVQRYDAWARRFAEAGYAFCGNDHLGHGRTAPAVEELGYTAPKDGADYLVGDLHTMSTLAKEAFPGVPLVLYGHSMGSFAARVYLTRYGTELSGALISGTAGPGNPTGLALMLNALIGKSKGLHHRSRFLSALAFGAYNKRFAAEKDVFSWLTRDAATRSMYERDTYCHFLFTSAGYDTMFTLLHEISRKKWADGVPKTLPVLLFSGDMDPVGGYGKGVRKIYERMCAAGCNVKLKLYALGRHEMHNELNRDEVFDDLVAFLEEILV